MRVLPVAFGIFSLQFPAGLVLYFCVSNFWRLGQQEVIFRRYGTAANPTHRATLKASKADAAVDVESRERVDVDDDDEDVGPEEPRELDAGPTAKPTKATPSKSASSTRKAAPTKRDAKPPTKATAKPATKSTGGNGAKPVAPAPKSSGGFRSIFQLPPPPGEIPKAAPAKPASKTTSSKPAPSAKSPTASSPTARPGTTGRRTSKKKPKR
jgi:hypothetical protein